MEMVLELVLTEFYQWALEVLQRRLQVLVWAGWSLAYLVCLVLLLLLFSRLILYE